MNDTLMDVQTEYYKCFLIRYNIYISDRYNKRAEIVVVPTNYTNDIVTSIFMRRCMTRVTGRCFKNRKQAKEFIDGCYKISDGNRSINKNYI